MIAAWRRLGLEVAFDPGELPARVVGRERLAADLANLDAERLMRCYPRDDDDRLTLDQLVLLAPVEVSERLAAPKQAWLVAASPVRRRDQQVVTLALRDEIGRNFRHRWDLARWLWDARHAQTSEEERWGTSGFPLDVVAAADARTRLAARVEAGTATTGERAALAVVLVRAGAWREALALYGVTHALEELPATYNVPREHWDDALAAWMSELAPWRLAGALARMEPKQREWRLFNFPGEKTAKKHCVMLRRERGVPHLAPGFTASNARAPDHYWRWPVDLALRLRGSAPAVAAASRAASGSTAADAELRAQIAADPDADDARRVFADLLAERGDPRGEFIVLQLLAATGTLPGKAEKRMHDLQRVRWRDWLGPLAPLAMACRFERGFAVACTLGSDTTPFDAWAAAVSPRGLEELSLVRELELAGPFPRAIAVELVGALRWLRRVSIGAALVDAELPRVEAVEVRVADEREGIAVAERVLAPDRAQPAELHLRLPSNTGTATLVARAIERAQQLPLGLQRIAIRGALAIELSRGGDRRMSALTVAMPTSGPRQGIALRDAIAICPVGSLTRVHVTGPITEWAQQAARDACAPHGIAPTFAR